MGLNWRALGFAGLAAGTLLTGLPRRPREDADPGDPGREARLRAVSQKLAEARLYWSGLAEREAALAWADSLRPGTPATRLHGFPTGSRNQFAEDELAALWRRLGAPDSAVTVGAWIYNLAGYETRNWGNAFRGNLITRVDGHVRCIAILFGEVQPDGRVRVWRESLTRTLAPCLFLARFGPPGPHIAAWLERTHWVGARSPGWLTRPADYPAGDSEGPWGWLYDYSTVMVTPTRAPFSLVRALGAEELAQLLAPPYYYGAPGVRCIVGDAAACAAALLQEGRTAEPVLPADLAMAQAIDRTGMTLGTPRPPNATLLSDLVRARGPERFLAFWRSTLPVAEAYQASYGEPLGTWAAQWAGEAWRASWNARYRSPTVLIGPTLEVRWIAGVVGWSLLAFALAAHSARRRLVL